MGSYFVRGADSKDYGPVTLEVLRRWVAEGRIIAETYLREENSDTWRHAREFPEIAPLVAPVASSFNAASGQPIVATENAEQLLARDHPARVGEWIGEGWRFYWATWAEITGYTLLTFLLQMAAGMIPCLGYFAGIFITPMLYVGLYYYLIKKRRGQPTAINDLFAGFQFFYVPSLVANLLFMLLLMIAFLPIGIAVGALVTAGVFAGFGAPGWTPDFPTSAIVVLAAAILLSLAIGFYLSTTFLFWPQLVAGHKLGGWDALRVSHRVVRRHLFGMLGFVIVVGLISLAGVLVCGVGAIFSMPLALCCFVVAYDAIFGARPDSSGAPTA